MSPENLPRWTYEHILGFGFSYKSVIVAYTYNNISHLYTPQVPVTAQVHKSPGAASPICPSPDPGPSHKNHPSWRPLPRPTVQASPDTFLAPPLRPSVKSPAPAQPVAEPAVVSNLVRSQSTHQFDSDHSDHDMRWVKSICFSLL